MAGLIRYDLLIKKTVDHADSDSHDEQNDRTYTSKPVELSITCVACILSIERIVVAAADGRCQTVILGILNQNDQYDHNACQRQQNTCSDLYNTHRHI